PDPDRPVKTIMASRGRSTETSFRLCSRAPRTIRRSDTSSLSAVLEGYSGSSSACPLTCPVMLTRPTDKNFRPPDPGRRFESIFDRGAWFWQIRADVTSRVRSARIGPARTNCTDGINLLGGRMPEYHGNVKVGGPAQTH